MAYHHIQFEYRTIAHANWRGHWRAKAALVRKERLLTCAAWVSHGGFIPKLPCLVTFTRLAPKKLDEGDNLASAFKSMRDELADMWRVDDSPGSGITWEYRQYPPQELGYPKGSYWVLIDITDSVPAEP